MKGPHNRISFVAADAAEFGILEAVILSHITYWVRGNASEGRNISDGSVWMYNSVRGLSEYFGFCSESQVRHALKKLETCGALLSSHMATNSFDRTKWYALGPKYLEMHHELAGEILRFSGVSNAFDRNSKSSSEGSQISFEKSDKCFEKSSKSDLRNFSNDIKVELEQNWNNELEQIGEAREKKNEEGSNQDLPPWDPHGYGAQKPTQEACREYFKKKGRDPKEGELFWQHYESQGWLKGNKMPIVNWQALADRWQSTEHKFTGTKTAKAGKGAQVFSEDDYR